MTHDHFFRVKFNQHRLAFMLLTALLLSAAFTIWAADSTKVTRPLALDETALSDAGLKALEYAGLQNVQTIDRLQNAQSRLVTYRQWLDFTGTDLDEVSLRTLGWSYEMPVFIIAAEGEVIARRSGMPPGDGLPAQQNSRRTSTTIHLSLRC